MATVQINTKRLHTIMAQRLWSEQDLAREMGLAYSFVNRIVNGRRVQGDGNAPISRHWMGGVWSTWWWMGRIRMLAKGRV